MAALSSIVNRFSVKTFISDLARILNECFLAIHDCISKFYDEQSNKITCNQVDAVKVNATTIVAQNLSLKDSSTGMALSYDNLIKEVMDLKKRLKRVEIEVISPGMIDALDNEPNQ